MRYRDYKYFHADGYYHIYNRGNNRQKIFLDEADYYNFLKRLSIVLFGSPVIQNLRIVPLPKNAFSILCYCLMPSHFHLLIKQNTILGIDRLISKVCTSYAIYFNKKYERVGHVFQDTFKAKEVDSDTYCQYLSAYIHNNPKHPEDYAYSSFRGYTGKLKSDLCQTDFILGYFDNDPERYREFVLTFSQEQEKEIGHLLF